ncbi:lysophospholipid acyltransferase family protein [Paenibacillus alkalitolerans]|uniref:lysophospholipid acyltransferase family protein n=1 Tax=Paenibacillus alkalitolerans TaxID=2799335 RepID=UPI0018F4C72F|nr:lysophospholipid acyltransferase family protein [Paenibacillus alkalitolerans]
MLYTIAQMILRVFFGIIYRFQPIGVDRLPAEGPVIVCCNHQNNLDPPIVGCPLPRMMHFMAKAELFRVPVLSSIIRQVGAFPVNRGGMSKESIRTALQLLKEGRVICIFPEGTRQTALGAGKKGAASLAVRSGAWVVPAAIIGSYRLFQPLKVVYGEPYKIATAEDLPASAQLEVATERIMASIRELIERHS